MVQDIDEIKKIITNRKKLTNCFQYYDEILKWIEEDKTYIHKVNNSLFLLLKSNDFYKFYYFIEDYSDITLAKDFLTIHSKNHRISMEFTTKKTTDIQLINNLVEQLGFTYYSEFARLISGTNNLKEKVSKTFQLAESKDINNLLIIMNKEFDSIIDNIPQEDELLSLINSKSIILKYYENKLIFIQIFEYKLGSLYSRMTWISKKFRKPKYTIDMYSEIDSYLEHLNINNNTRAYYWVDVTNRNFLIGQKLGSKPDGLRCITYLYNKEGSK